MKPLVIILTLFCTFLPELQADIIQQELEVCLKLMNEGRFEKAREQVQKFRRAHPDNPRGLLLLAQLEEDFKRSLALFREAEFLALQPGTSAPDSSLAAEAVFARAEMVFTGGNLSTAVDIYEHLINSYRSSDLYPDALYRLGIIHLVNGTPEKAIENFKMCLENDPDGAKRSLASVGIMECHVELKNWSEVLEAAREVLEENDEESSVTPRVLEVISNAWQELGNEDNAAWYTERLLNNYPDSFQAHVIREKGNRIAKELSLSLDSSADSNVTVDRNGSLSETNEPLKPSDEKSLVFSVQAAAFKERTNAYRMYKNLKNAGFDVRVEMRTVRDEHIYKVLIGRYKTRKEADEMVARVTRAAGEKAFIVKVE